MAQDEPAIPVEPVEPGLPSGGRGGLVSWRALRAALLIVGLCLAATIAGHRLVREAALAEERASVERRLDSSARALSMAIDSRLAVLGGVQAFVAGAWGEPQFDAKFDTFAAAIERATPGIRTLQYIVDGVVKQTSPRAGNEAVVGKSLYTHPDAEVRRGIRAVERSHGVVLNGPIRLLQGGTGLVGRLAVRDAHDRLVCVVACVLDLPPVLRAARLDNPEGLEVSLFDPERGQIAGAARSPDDASWVEADVLLADRRWVLAGRPLGGWGAIAARRATLYWLAAGSFSLLLGALGYLLIAAFAASARQQEAQERLRWERRFTKLFQLIPDGVALTRISDDVVLEVNQSLADMLGYAREEFIGRTAMDLGVWAVPQERSFMRERIAKVGLVHHGATFRRKDGTTIQVESAVRLFDLQGQTCVLSIIRDVSVTRSLQRQLLQSQKMEALGTLAGGVAHDFNNVLAIIVSFAQLAKGAAAGNPALEDDVDQITLAAGRAAALVRQLLAFARQQAIDPQAIDLNELVRESEPLLARLLRSDVSLRTTLSNHHLVVRMDRGQLDQVIMNLVANARDAMPGGGVIRLETALSGSEVLLTVRDTGTGIPSEIQNKIFEPFFTTKAPGKGTGLGLATSYGIVQQAGGRIEVESTPGAGAAFRICLPRMLEAPPEPVAVAAAVPALPRGSGQTILLVEDEPALRDAATRMLHTLGYEVVAAAGGEDALRLSQPLARGVDLLVTDVVMAGLSGTELAARLRNSRPELPILFISGFADERAIRDQFQPAVGFLGKPFSLDALAAAVQTALDPGRRPFA